MYQFPLCAAVLLVLCKLTYIPWFFLLRHLVSLPSKYAAALYVFVNRMLEAIIGLRLYHIFQKRVKFFLKYLIFLLDY